MGKFRLLLINWRTNNQWEATKCAGDLGFKHIHCTRNACNLKSEGGTWHGTSSFVGQPLPYSNQVKKSSKHQVLKNEDRKGSWPQELPARFHDTKSKVTFYLCNEEGKWAKGIGGDLDVGRLVVELAADVDVGGAGAHGAAGDQATLDEFVRVVAHDLAVLARARLALVGVDDQIARPAVRRLVHEAPLQARREAGAAATAQTRLLHLACDRVQLTEVKLGLVMGQGPSISTLNTFGF